MGAHDEPSAGIIELYCPEKGEPEIDIVAVHGLNGDARKTWTSKSNRVCWLNHPDFLPRYAKNARVLSWGYNARVTALKGHAPSKDRIHHHAQTLVANLSAERMISNANSRPIIWICHSLGGIIVKRALSYAQLRTGHKVCHQHDIFTSSHGILFFGTPHLGSSKATWLDYLTRVASASTPKGFSFAESGLTRALREDSETLQNITDNFVPIMKNFNIYFFWEQDKTDLKALGKDHIVTSESAAPTFDETERSGIAACHSGMVKFEDPSSQGLRMAASAIARYCREAPEAIARRKGLETVTLSLQREHEANSLGLPGPAPTWRSPSIYSSRSDTLAYSERPRTVDSFPWPGVLRHVGSGGRFGGNRGPQVKENEIKWVSSFPKSKRED